MTSQKPSQCHLPIVVPEAVNEVVRHGSHHCVKYSGNPVLMPSVTKGAQVDTDCCTIGHKDHSEERPTAGEGLLPARGRGDPEDGGEDVCV